MVFLLYMPTAVKKKTSYKLQGLAVSIFDG